MIPFSAILIAGPTASGKSALAADLARRYRGVVINADSMQVYRDLRILTARPGDEELAAAPHELYGHVDGAEAYSAGRWVADAARVIQRCRDDGLMPIVVGGTGLYFKALLEGLSPIPDIPPDIRSRWREEAAHARPGELHRRLSERDPATAARLIPSDLQRLTRALEVLDATGLGLSEWQKQKGTPVLPAGSAKRYVLSPERSALHAAADARFDRMMKEGAMEEVRTLAGRGLPPSLPVMRALGVGPLLAALAGRIPLSEAIDRSKLDTRQYIKRQETWLRKHMTGWEPQSATQQ